MKNLLAVCLLIVFGAWSCSLFISLNTKVEENIQMSDDKEITITTNEVYLYEEGSFAPSRNSSEKGRIENFEYSITLVAKISPVSVSNTRVQANDIVISGSTAYVAYNYAGDVFRGAIQIIDISDSSLPVIEHEIKFTSMDINALYIDGSSLIFAGSADPDIWGFRSFVGKFSADSPDLSTLADNLTSLASYATTGITRKGDSYYISVGADEGEIEILDLSLNNTDSIEIEDIRDIEAYQSGIIALCGTTDSTNTNGYIITYEGNTLTPTYLAVPNFKSPYHKATIEMYNANIALLGLSEAGMHIYDMRSTSSTYKTSVFHSPVPQSTGEEVYANSASYDGNLIFLSLGEYGFRVYRVTRDDFSTTTLVGYIPYSSETDESGNTYSANHIEYKANTLFVASGVGGVSVYKLSSK